MSLLFVPGEEERRKAKMKMTRSCFLGSVLIRLYKSYTVLLYKLNGSEENLEAFSGKKNDLFINVTPQNDYQRKSYKTILFALCARRAIVGTPVSLLGNLRAY